MNRRDFFGVAAASAVALGLERSGFATAATSPQFAITMDDFNWRNAVHLTAEERNRAILDVLGAKRTRAALFVMGRNVDNDEGKVLLRSWDNVGHIIGNHTYSHRSLNSE